MTLKEMMVKVKAVYDENEDNYEFIGMRLENKVRVLGEICGKSRHGNIDDNDDRTFPDYNNDRYKNMFCFAGTSAWDLSDGKEAYRFAKQCPDADAVNSYEQDHCYIIAGNYNCNQDDGLDYNEVVIEDAKVIAVIF